MITQRARDNLCTVAFCNLVGGQDELVFDGQLIIIDHEGAHPDRGRRSSARGCMLAQRRPPGGRDPRACATPGCARRGARARLRQGAEGEVWGQGVEAARAARGAARRRRRRPAALPGRRGLRGANARRARLPDPRTASTASLLGLSGGIDSTLVALIAADGAGGRIASLGGSRCRRAIRPRARAATPRSWPRPSACSCSSCRSRDAMSASTTRCSSRVRRPRS